MSEIGLYIIGSRSPPAEAFRAFLEPEAG